MVQKIRAGQGDPRQSSVAALNSVIQTMEEVTRACAGAQLVVVSYNGRNLQAATSWGRHSGVPVLTHSFSNLNFPYTTVSAGANQPGWFFGHVIDEQDALRALESALGEHRAVDGSSAVRKTDLRFLLERCDKRFERKGKAIETGTAGLMSALVRSAADRDLIEIDNVQPQNPRIWLKSKAGCTEFASTTAVQSASHNGQENSAIPSNGRSVGVLVPAVDGHSENREMATSSTAACESKEAEIKHRSRQFEESVQKRKMGPYTTCRLAIYSVLPQILAERKGENGISVKDLLALAEQGAKEQLASVPEKEENLGDQPWRKINVFMTNLLTKSGALLDGEGKSIAPGFSSGLEIVHELAPEWQIMADAEIVLALLHDWHDVSQHDLANLAGLLYHDRDDAECHEQVLQVVAYLVKTARVVQAEGAGTTFIRLATA